MKKIARAIILYLITVEAKLVLKKYKPTIVGVTGSVGKTSAKDAIHAVLAEQFYVAKSKKSMNSEFGVPLSILMRESGWGSPFSWIMSLWEGATLILFKNHYPSVLVLEVGADHPGDIGAIAGWIQPQVAVVTGVPDVPVHIEFFGSVEEVAREKRKLVEATTSKGAVVLNGDDARAYEMRKGVPGKVYSYGFGTHNEIHASHVETMYEGQVPHGVRFRINHRGSSVPVAVQGALGHTQVYPALAAAAVGLALKMDLVTIGKGLLHYEPAPGRMRIVAGRKGSTIIDDTYNSSPAAMVSALATLKTIQGPGRKYALLADMKELGKFSDDAHARIGAESAHGIDWLVTVGEQAKVIAESARTHGLHPERITEFSAQDSQKAGETVARRIERGDIILVKGSQSMRMEKAVKELMAEPLRAKELLVRQNSEWLARH